MQVEALGLKLCALNSMIERLQPVQKKKAEVTANVILSLIDRMRTEVSPQPMRYSQFESDAYNAHGRIAFDEGSEESARRSVNHFEKSLQVFKAIGDDDGIVNAKHKHSSCKIKV